MTNEELLEMYGKAYYEAMMAWDYGTPNNLSQLKEEILKRMCMSSCQEIAA